MCVCYVCVLCVCSSSLHSESVANHWIVNGEVKRDNLRKKNRLSIEDQGTFIALFRFFPPHSRHRLKRCSRVQQQQAVCIQTAGCYGQSGNGGGKGNDRGRGSSRPVDSHRSHRRKLSSAERLVFPRNA